MRLGDTPPLLPLPHDPPPLHLLHGACSRSASRSISANWSKLARENKASSSPSSAPPNFFFLLGTCGVHWPMHEDRVFGVYTQASFPWHGHGEMRCGACASITCNGTQLTEGRLHLNMKPRTPSTRLLVVQVALHLRVQRRHARSRLRGLTQAACPMVPLRGHASPLSACNWRTLASQSGCLRRKKVATARIVYMAECRCTLSWPVGNSCMRAALESHPRQCHRRRHRRQSHQQTRPLASQGAGVVGRHSHGSLKAAFPAIVPYRGRRGNHEQGRVGSVH